MRTQSVDTTPEMEQVQIDLLRHATVARRLSLLRALSFTMIQLARRAIRRLNPKADEKERQLIFVRLHYSQELGDRLAADLNESAQMKIPDTQAALVPLVDALEEMGIRYQIGGSVASSAHGVPRGTLDIRLVADIGPDHVSALVERLSASYYIDESQIRDALQRRASFNAIHLESMFKLDVFLAKLRLYDQQIFERSQKAALDEAEGAREFNLASPEDVVLKKLEWYREGGDVSERQWNDVLGVLKVQGKSLDFFYIRRWSPELGISDLVDRALGDAGMPTTLS